jgi:hypothetical protein
MGIVVTGLIGNRESGCLKSGMEEVIICGLL